MSRQSSWEGDAAAGLVMAAVLLTVFIVVAAGKVALATLKEIGRVYAENYGGDSARLLWYALGGLFSLWLLCGVLAATVPAVGAACVYCAAWGFLAYVVAIEVIDWQARRAQPRKGELGSLDTYLGGPGQSFRGSTTADSAVGD